MTVWQQTLTDSEVRVDPPILSRAADQLSDLARRLRRADVVVDDEVAHAASVVADWRIGHSLRELMRWWDQEETAFGRQLAALGEGLRTSAVRYQHSDTASAADFGAIA